MQKIMNIPPESIEELQDIWEEVTGDSLSFDECSDQAEKILSVLENALGDDAEEYLDM